MDEKHKSYNDEEAYRPSGDAKDYPELKALQVWKDNRSKQE